MNQVYYIYILKNQTNSLDYKDDEKFIDVRGIASTGWDKRYSINKDYSRKGEGPIIGYSDYQAKELRYRLRCHQCHANGFEKPSAIRAKTIKHT